MHPIQKAKLAFGAAAALSLLLSVTLWFLVDKEQGLFVGLWVPSILALGAFMIAGISDRSDAEAS
ncbi:MAG: hypothetical protein ACF8XB_02205 [Planctomycetota bacterium JB042]